MFFIEGVVIRGKKMRKDCNGTPHPVPMWKVNEFNNKSQKDCFLAHDYSRTICWSIYQSCFAEQIWVPHC
jgi:hypothetical protein